MTHEQLISEGWRSIEVGDLPPRDEIVEFAQDEQTIMRDNWHGTWAALPPSLNIAGLWWRPEIIGFVEE